MKYSAAVHEHGSLRAAARALGVPYATFHGAYTKEVQGGAKAKRAAFSVPKLPRVKRSAEAIIDLLARETEAKAKRRAAERWMPVYVNDKRPIGILWFGDPHLGTSTNWKRLKDDARLCVTTPGLYGANIGDATNNWVGSLTRLYADEDISRETERILIKWFLAECGITWLLWIMGNHDDWEHGATIIRQMDIHNRVTMSDWESRLRLVFAGKREVKIHAAHDFPGSSMHNPTHGGARAVRFLGSDAHLYVCGHRHTFGLQQFETPETGRCPVIVRVAGYKTGDPHARRLGFPEATAGSSVLTIIDPTAGPAGQVLAFADVEQGARVLRALRGGK